MSLQKCSLYAKKQVHSHLCRSKEANRTGEVNKVAFYGGQLGEDEGWPRFGKNINCDGMEDVA